MLRCTVIPRHQRKKKLQIRSSFCYLERNMYVGETFRNNSFNFVTIRYSKRKSSFLKKK